jgi:hypothetical protein
VPYRTTSVRRLLRSRHVFGDVADCGVPSVRILYAARSQVSRGGWDCPVFSATVDAEASSLLTSAERAHEREEQRSNAAALREPVAMRDVEAAAIVERHVGDHCRVK